MNKIDISNEVKKVFPIGIGCMRINSLSDYELEKFLSTALECGYNFFDHADIYGDGSCETLFGKAIKNLNIDRENLFIQSKCGIICGESYCFEKQYILDCVDSSLSRLGTDYLDVLLLHRPDILSELNEVAEAFHILKASGKVKSFGVSNHNPLQIELLQKATDEKICVNQMQFGPAYTQMLDSGINVNMMNQAGINRDGYIRDYCRLNDITLQLWSPFQHGFFEGAFFNSDKYGDLNRKLSQIGEKYLISKEAAAIAWILRLPENNQPILGTTNSQRIREISAAADVRLSHKEWYEIYLAAGNKLP